MTRAAGPTRLLLVDDTADLRLLLRIAFEASGRYQVVAEAGDGLEALELVATLGPSIDLIVLDLSMPRMDGLEALPRLREQLPEVPVVVLSGFAASSTAPAVMAAGATVYLEKGLRPDELVAAVEEARLAAAGRAASPPAALPPVEAAAPAAPPADPEPDPDPDPEPDPDPDPELDLTSPSTHEVVAELAHDVRSPLFVAREVVRVLRRSIDDDQLLDLADRAMAAVDRVDLTLESAIEHARLGQAPLTLCRHELRGLLTELVAGLDQRGARRVQLDGPAVHARVDPGAFSRVAGNLLHNALHYSDGLVEIVTGQDGTGPVRVVVRDHGPGLGASPAALFAPFARGSAGRDRAGTGLGLATARRMAERMDGHLEGADAEGGGARFTLTLPSLDADGR